MLDTSGGIANTICKSTNALQASGRRLDYIINHQMIDVVLTNIHDHLPIFQMIQLPRVYTCAFYNLSSESPCNSNTSEHLNYRYDVSIASHITCMSLTSTFLYTCMYTKTCQPQYLWICTRMSDFYRSHACMGLTHAWPHVRNAIHVAMHTHVRVESSKVHSMYYTSSFARPRVTSTMNIQGSMCT